MNAMSNIESFQELLAKNDEVKGKIEKLVAAEGKSQDELIAGIIALAKEYGISLSEEDIQVRDQELSEEELTDVSGGTNNGRSLHRNVGSPLIHYTGPELTTKCIIF